MVKVAKHTSAGSQYDWVKAEFLLLWLAKHPDWDLAD